MAVAFRHQRWADAQVPLMAARALALGLGTLQQPCFQGGNQLFQLLMCPQAGRQAGGEREGQAHCPSAVGREALRPFKIGISACLGAGVSPFTALPLQSCDPCCT